jgi:sugar O-acyltransferase (sialic acid O-acetyltransferase NeuD family)
MPTEAVIVFGAGGHAKVVIDALQILGYSSNDIIVRDDRDELHGTTLLGCSVEAPITPPRGFTGRVHAAVGSAAVRKKLLERSEVAVERWLTVIHPGASVAGSSEIGQGSLVAAQAVVGPCAKVGTGVIVNHGAVVDHDCWIGAYSHVAPCASLGGGVQIGERVLVGAGARILPGLKIGDDVTIGAGAVVVNDIPSGQSWRGVPAKPSG